MPHMGLSEFFVIALLALVRYGIPVAFAVWVFRSFNVSAQIRQLS